MNRFAKLFPLLTALLIATANATPQEAAGIEKEFQLAMEKFSLQVRLATTPETRAAALESRPDPAAFADRMWKAIGTSLDQEWTIEPASWFIRLAGNQLTQQADGSTSPAYSRQIEAIRNSVEKNHMSSGKVAPFCLALVATGDPRSLGLLEKIEISHPDPKIQGVAALASAMLMKTLGDETEITRKRIPLIRKAIIQSADVEIDGTSVAQLADNELYIIRFLSKGRVAPDLEGVDSGGLPMKLSAQQGKIVVLLFWNSSVQDSERLLQISAEMAAKFQGRDIMLIGVNNDPIDKLRSMQADRLVTWPNFSDPENKLSRAYRIGSWPLAYVLDGERKIQYAGAPGSFVELAAEALLSKKEESTGE